MADNKKIKLIKRDETIKNTDENLAKKLAKKSLKKVKLKSKTKVIQSQTQYVSLPFRLQDGQILVLLITSRETKRWILPKGNPEKNLLPHQVAELEALEEAGVKGKINDVVFARYLGTKRLANGREIPCEMVIYPLQVLEILDDWREKKERERLWLPPNEAADIAGDEGLSLLLKDFAKLWT